MNEEYFPIRSRMAVVGIIQLVVSALILAGVSSDLVNGWATWAVSVVDFLVLIGVLAAGTVHAERNTTPLFDSGDPINPSYARISDGT